MTARHVCCGCGGLCDSGVPCPMAYNCANSQRTRSAIGELKAEWKRDGGEWDLEDAPGWEAHRDELLAFRKETEAAWEAEAKREHEADIQKLMAPALALLPEHADDGLSRAVAETVGSTSNIILRMVAEMLLPVVKRLAAVDARLSEFDEETNQTLAEHQAELDELRGQIGAA